MRKKKMTADEAFLLHTVQNSVVERLNTGSLCLEEIFDDSTLIHKNEMIVTLIRDYINETLRHYAHDYDSLVAHDKVTQQKFWYHVTEYIQDEEYKVVSNMTYEDFLYQWHCDNKF
jgi:hypothetical protein